MCSESLVQELIQLGPMPTDVEAEVDSTRVARWAHLLGQLVAEGGISDDEARSLADLFPSDDSDSFGLAWTLVHLVESAPSWPIREAVDRSSGPWAEILAQRASL